jgi:hypothetical protein
MSKAPATTTPTWLWWTVWPGNISPNKSFSPYIASVSYFMTGMREGATTTNYCQLLIFHTHYNSHSYTLGRSFAHTFPSCPHSTRFISVFSALTARAGILKARGPAPLQLAHPHKHMQKRHNNENPHYGCCESVSGHWRTLVVCLLTPAFLTSDGCSFPCP